jgi:hypothetical protein
VFGSVAWPVRIPPKPCASIHRAAAVAIATIRRVLVAAGTNTPTAMRPKRIARTTVTALPWVPMAAAVARAIAPIQPGSPAAPPVTASRSAPGARLGASSRKYAPLPQIASHVSLAQRPPSSPPAAMLVPSAVRERVGHAMTAISA